MVRVVFLGNCANQTASNEAVNLLIESNEGRLLIDAGPGVVRQIYKAGYMCQDIGSVIVTHCHGDHTLGYPYFIFSHFYESLRGKKGPDIINVAGTESILKGLDSMLHFCYLPERYPFKIKEVQVSDSQVSSISLGGFRITSSPVEHSTPTIGLRIEVEDTVICYSSDTIYSKNVVSLASNADLLIHEGFATSELEEMSRKVKHGISREAGQVATEANARFLALVHLFPPFIGREKELISEASKFYEGPIIVPSELQSIELRRNLPPKIL